jgi:hypothetical protein
MRISRSTGAVSGLTIVLLGLWGALIPFVGPYFDYAFGVNSTWRYTSDRLWLNILPGAAAALAGAMLLVTRRRRIATLAASCAVIAGAWFVTGPAVSLTWESGVGPIGAPLFGPTRQMLELLGYFYGVGTLIVALGAFALARVRLVPAIETSAVPPARGPSPGAPPPGDARDRSEREANGGREREASGGRARRGLRFPRRERRVGA